MSQQNVTYTDASFAPLTFYLFDELMLDVSGITQGLLDASDTLQLFDCSANAICRVNQSVLSELFQYWSDSIDMSDNIVTDLFWRVHYDGSGGATNTAYSKVGAPLTTDFVSGSIVTGNVIPNDNMNPDALARHMITHDFLRYLAKRLFNTTRGVDLFANETEVLVSINDRSHLALENRLLGLDVAGAHDDEDYKIEIDQSGVPSRVSQTPEPLDNPARKIMRQMLKNQANRFQDISANRFGDNDSLWYKMPFKPNDEIVFPVFIESPYNQNDLTLVGPIETRSYKVTLKVVPDSEAITEYLPDAACPVPHYGNVTY